MSREFIAVVGEREVAVRAQAGEAGSWLVAVDGRDIRVDARQVRAGTWSLLVDGRALLVDLDERATGTVIRVGDREVQVKLVDAHRHRLVRAAQREGGARRRGEVICAPIAGKVVKLLVELGAHVGPRQPVVVLEAMKMENELCAERGGVVKEVHTSAGASIDTGTPLLTLE
jgi:biotin carboxyl carrier protein